MKAEEKKKATFPTFADLAEVYSLGLNPTTLWAQGKLDLVLEMMRERKERREG